MKCKNCGASYASRELYCPYCETPNPRGVLWSRQRAAAMADYEKGMELLPLLRRAALNRILNRVLLVEAALLALFVVGVFAAFALGELAHQAGAQMQRDELQEEFERLYAEGRYGELYSRLQETDLFGEEQYEYSQMALLYYDYEDFCQGRLDYYAEMDAGELRDYTLERLIGRMHDVLQPYIPAYPELTERNAAQTAEYAEEVRAFGRAVLGFTEEDMRLFGEDYLTMEQEEALVRAAEERGAVG